MATLGEYTVLGFVTIAIQNSISLLIDSRESNQRKRQLQRERHLIYNLISSTDLFASISTFQIIQSRATSPRMKPVLTVLAWYWGSSQNLKFGLLTLSFCTKQQCKCLRVYWCTDVLMLARMLGYAWNLFDICSTGVVFIWYLLERHLFIFD